MRFQKFISAILHPIVMPTVGVILYFIFIPHRIVKPQQTALLSLVFVSTYLVPILLLFLLKKLKLIQSYQTHSIKERKIPLFFMIALFYTLGKTFASIMAIRDIGFLFYGTSLGLIVVYILFFKNLKTSLHLLSLGNAIGFFLSLSVIYSVAILPIIILFILLSGLVASARLHLKVHTPKEIYVGFFIGIISQFLVLSFL